MDKKEKQVADDLLDNILKAVVLSTVSSLVPSWLSNPRVKVGASIVIIGVVSFVIAKKIYKVYTYRRVSNEQHS